MQTALVLYKVKNIYDEAGFNEQVEAVCKLIQGNPSASFAAANYRAACRLTSHPDFINKLKIVEEELDESTFFLEMIAELNSSFQATISVLSKEGNKLLAIIVAGLKTLRSANHNS